MCPEALPLCITAILCFIGKFLQYIFCHCPENINRILDRTKISLKNNGCIEGRHHIDLEIQQSVENFKVKA